MNNSTIHLRGDLHFKLRFNTAHGATSLYWRVFIGKEEYLARSLQCDVPTHSDVAYDAKAGAVKYNLAGQCSEFYIDENDNAFFK